MRNSNLAVTALVTFLALLLAAATCSATGQASTQVVTRSSLIFLADGQDPHVPAYRPERFSVAGEGSFATTWRGPDLGTTPSSHAVSVLRVSKHHCRDVVIRNGNGSIFTRTYGLSKRRVPCTTARQVARKFISFEGEGGPPRPLGFKCSFTSRGVKCKRGYQLVDWIFKS